MKSVEELASYFVYYVTHSKVGIEARIKAACTSIPKLLTKGWSLYEIKHELDQFARDYPQVVTNIYHIDEIMARKEPPNNLMEQDVFYYHNMLRDVSGPPRLKQDEHGNLIRYSEPFYLEMKNRFSMQELLDYWYKQMGIAPTEHMIRQDEGKFKYLLGNYTLDEVLFSIDCSKTIRSEMGLRMLRNAFEIEKYLEDAREFIKKKENHAKMNGINREIRRNEGYGSTSY